MFSVLPKNDVYNFIIFWFLYAPKMQAFYWQTVLKRFISSIFPPLLCVHLSQVVLHLQYEKPQPFFPLRLDYIFTKIISIFLVWIALGCLCVFLYPTDQNSLLTPIICFFLDLKERFRLLGLLTMYILIVLCVYVFFLSF